MSALISKKKSKTTNARYRGCSVTRKPTRKGQRNSMKKTSTKYSWIIRGYLMNLNNYSLSFRSYLSTTMNEEFKIALIIQMLTQIIFHFRKQDLFKLK